MQESTPPRVHPANSLISRIRAPLWSFQPAK
jgi:hypothetical protein